MSELRALLLIDVANSTQLSQELGDAAMAEVWTAHDRVARSLIDKRGGREIDKTDGMLLLFEAAADAVDYAHDYHRAIAALPVPLTARAGVHVGRVILRENSPYDIARGAKPLEVDGLAKPTTARVMSLALPGQTLLTADALDQIDKTAFKVASHGHWMVKGVAEPLEVFEVGDADTAFVQPPDSEKCFRVVRRGDWWMPVRDIPNNLPHQPTSFIGRERELAEVKSLMNSAKLLTLLGMGGLGKTRLSLQVAAELIHLFPDGVWFLDLAPIRDAELVVAEAAQVLGVREEPGVTLLQALCGHLKSRHALLILDNCEHVIEVCARMANAVLKAAPYVRILASSREVLRTPGEQVYPVLPLPVPARGDALGALSRSTAVRLFIDRARLHKPSFSLTERDAPIVAELVARLEGIPLALELAAARMRSLTVADINARLKDRYKLLTGGARVLQERQQTLRALVDWSYELLGPEERAVLNRLGVFIGGFDLAAAEAICSADALESDDVLDLVGSLVEKSLVMLEERDDGARYRMLETIREYAREKLELSGDDLAATLERHCLHYFAIAKAANRGLSGPDQADWLWRIEAELDNIRTATALSLSGGTDPFIAVKFAVAMQKFWILRGYSAEGRNVVRSALALPAIVESAVARAWALYVGAALAESESDYAEARQMLELCLELRRQLTSEVDIAATLSTLTLARLYAGDVEGAAAGETEALGIFRRLADRVGEAIGLLHLGQIRVFLGDDAGARQHLDACLAIARAIKHQELEGECELVLGESSWYTDDAAQADMRFKRSLTVCREAGDKRGEANAQWWLGKVAIKLGETAVAQQRLDEAVQAFRAFEMREEMIGCLEDHAVLACTDGAWELAIKLAAVAAAWRSRLDLRRSAPSALRWAAELQSIRQSVSPTAFETAWREGSEWQIDHAILSATARQRVESMAATTAA